jgi:GR25 family glycosyltransferase involved in LPS biosynthesis
MKKVSFAVERGTSLLPTPSITIPKDVLRFSGEVCLVKEEVEFASCAERASQVGIDHVFVITLAEAWERQACMRQTLAFIGVNATVCFMAAPPASVHESYVKWYQSQSGLLKKRPAMTGGELGCVMSHMHVLGCAATDSWARVLVLEDDVNVRQDFHQVMQFLMGSHPLARSDVVLLGVTDWSRHVRKATAPGSSVSLVALGDQTSANVCGTFGYVASRPVLRSLQTMMSSLTRPADHYWQFIPSLAVATPDVLIPDRSTSFIRPGFGAGSPEELAYASKCRVDVEDTLALYNRVPVVAVRDCREVLLQAIAARIEAAGKGRSLVESVKTGDDPVSVLKARTVRAVQTSSWDTEMWRVLQHDIAENTDVNEDMAVCMCVFNPAGFRRPGENLARVVACLQPRPVFIIQLVYHEEVGVLLEVPGAVVVQVRAGSVMFHKENLWNVLERSVPSKHTKLLFMDADIVFAQPGWYGVVSALLDSHAVVQPFRTISMTGGDGSTFRTIPSFMAVAAKRALKDVFRPPWGAPGYAFACRRDWFHSVRGLFDSAIMGGGDLFQAAAITGADISSFPAWTKQPYAHEDWHEFVRRVQTAARAAAAATPHIAPWTYAPLHITHLFHGAPEGRQYKTRHDHTQHLTSASVFKNACGVWEFVEAHTLNPVTMAYFSARKEDDDP